MKALRSEVDVLTLTATADSAHPGHGHGGTARLERDCHRAAAPAGHQDLCAQRGDNGTIREAVLRELNRGGQVYFLHNEVETIENRRHRPWRQLIPEARIAVAHGQIARARAGARDARLRGAAPQPVAVLDHHRDRHRRAERPTPSSSAAPTNSAWRSCTSCVGRVGRSHHQAYAYLLVPDTETPDQAGFPAPGGHPGHGGIGQQAFTWPCTTWRFAAPARCWAKTRAAT